MMTLDFGFSPCPNDTFMFWAWVHNHLNSKIDLKPKLADIQELNKLALSKESLPLTKLSANAYLQPNIHKNYRLLNVGAALGRGCGPLIISKNPWSINNPSPIALAVPGFDTTACRLARAALSTHVEKWVELRYDEIMPAVLAQEVDAGVIIHESRFAYQSLGLQLALDLGKWWEELTNLPLPLGVMVAHKNLEPATVLEVEKALAQSIELAWTLLDGDREKPNVNALWSYLKTNAIELEDSTIKDHIKLYVNEYSLDLKNEGRKAIEELASLAS